MTYRGHIKNGVAVLDEPVGLPDGTPVRIEVEPIDAEFWHGNSGEELARQQGVGPCVNPRDLACAWPEGESIDDFLARIRQGRV